MKAESGAAAVKCAITGFCMGGALTFLGVLFSLPLFCDSLCYFFGGYFFSLTVSVLWFFMLPFGGYFFSLTVSVLRFGWSEWLCQE